MCLAVPAKVLSIDDDFLTAEIDVMGNTKTVAILLVPDAEVGSWVLVHAGQAIGLVSEEEAAQSIELWEEVLRYDGQCGLDESQ
jgi:hydrogenase expression/formation protein HypC